MVKVTNKVLLVMTPWSNPRPLGRVWCLWEILQAVKLKATIRMILPSKEQDAFMLALQTKYGDVEKTLASIDVCGVRAWCSTFSCFHPRMSIVYHSFMSCVTVSYDRHNARTQVHNANATVESDKWMIFSEIERSLGSRMRIEKLCKSMGLEVKATSPRQVNETESDWLNRQSEKFFLRCSARGSLDEGGIVQWDHIDRTSLHSSDFTTTRIYIRTHSKTHTHTHTHTHTQVR